MEIFDYIVLVNFQWTFNWTFVEMCSLAPHQTVNKQDIYTDFSFLHGKGLLIHDLITVLPDRDNKLFRHIKHAPVILK